MNEQTNETGYDCVFYLQCDMYKRKGERVCENRLEKKRTLA